MNKVKAFSLRVHEKAELSIKEIDDKLELTLINKETGNSVEESYFRLDKGIDVQEAVKINTIIYHMHNKIGLNLWELT